MKLLGFSTGALSGGDFRQALSTLADTDTQAIELSALREHEFPLLIGALPELDLRRYRHVSIHLPSKLRHLREEDVVDGLLPFKDWGWRFVIHPDVVTDHKAWRVLGRSLCVENMDQRKRTGRTVSELCDVFDLLPEASLCFDIGHAKQIDPTMSHAASILRMLGERLEYVHVSDVDAGCNHQKLNRVAADCFALVSNMIPERCALILESPVSHDEIESELMLAASILG